MDKAVGPKNAPLLPEMAGKLSRLVKRQDGEKTAKPAEQ